MQNIHVCYSIYFFIMSTSKTFTGKWLGSFSYLQENEFTDQVVLPDVTFSLELYDENGSFTGTCIDDEVKDIMKGVITVKGFVDGDIISFTKQYPSFYFTDENGQIQVDPSQAHPPIIYSGIYDAECNTYSGEWEMTIATENIQGECFDDMIGGSWIISKAI